MSHVPHELADEFPDHANKLHELKISNVHFARIADQYHALNREIHRIEAGVEPATDERTTILRKQRLEMKDEISSLLADA
jgi:uncharacterized protein YdcH (DUF465 family)